MYVCRVTTEQFFFLGGGDFHT